MSRKRERESLKGGIHKLSMGDEMREHQGESTGAVMALQPRETREPQSTQTTARELRRGNRLLLRHQSRLPSPKTTLSCLLVCYSASLLFLPRLPLSPLSLSHNLLPKLPLPSLLSFTTLIANKFLLLNFLSNSLLSIVNRNNVSILIKICLWLVDQKFFLLSTCHSSSQSKDNLLMKPRLPAFNVDSNVY